MAMVMRRRSRALVTLGVWCLVGAALGGPFPARAALVLNEVLYDPSGPDSGFEFVELYNSGPGTENLAGVELVFVNGSTPDRPRSVWVGRAGMQLEAGRWWVIAEDAVPEADVRVTLALQNGSEALRLRRGAVVVDALAWGDGSAVGEGRPAPDVSGQSLARIPDGRDRGDNAGDFRPLDEANPGTANALPEAFRLIDWSLDPPWLAEAGRADLSLELEAVGWREQQELSVQLRADELSTRRLRVARGDTARVDFQITCGSNLRELELQLGERSVGLPVHVGPAELRLNEVMARPNPAEPEWIELAVASPDSLDLEGWTIADATGIERRLGDLRLGPGVLALLSSEPAALIPMRPVEILRPTGGWPALNQSDGAGEEGESFADELLLRDAGGAVVDWVRWRAADVDESGRSLERAAVTASTPSLWLKAPRSATPGMVNDAASYPPPTSGLSVEPNPFTPDGDGQSDLLHVALRDAGAASSVEAEILDLSGDRVVTLQAARSREVVQWIWDGRDGRGRTVAWGAYLLRISGSMQGEWRHLIAVGGAE